MFKDKKKNTESNYIIETTPTVTVLITTDRFRFLKSVLNGDVSYKVQKKGVNALGETYYIDTENNDLQIWDLLKYLDKSSECLRCKIRDGRR